jgi:hypothetical protein
MTCLRSQIATSKRAEDSGELIATSSYNLFRLKVLKLEVANCDFKFGGVGVMSSPKRIALLPAQRVESLIYLVRAQRVMLDFDLAQIYGVSTQRLNQQVRRNKMRFPEDFAFQLTHKEVDELMSQNVIPAARYGGRRTRPLVFTEQGIAMLSSVLRSPMAVRVNIEIMRAFVRLRRLLATPGEIVAQLTKLAETVELHDDQIRVIDEVLRKMMEPLPDSDKPKRRFGFHMPEPHNNQAHLGKGAFP